MIGVLGVHIAIRGHDLGPGHRAVVVVMVTIRVKERMTMRMEEMRVPVVVAVVVALVVVVVAVVIKNINRRRPLAVIAVIEIAVARAVAIAIVIVTVRRGRPLTALAEVDHETVTGTVLVQKIVEKTNPPHPRAQLQQHRPRPIQPSNRLSSRHRSKQFNPQN